MTAEEQRLEEARLGIAKWRRWGPYLSERQWGTVREDYSSSGTAWDYFTHDQARARAYRWGEDGLAGISDDHQRLCFALALWNGQDPILKERAFGLNGSEGNHGEDVKEYYFYLDNVPSHAYMQYLYKYPQRAFPYANLVAENQRRGRQDPEYELLDTGVFDDDRYFDVLVEYAKAAPEDILIQISVANRGPEAAPLHLLPTLWFRNTWSWFPGAPKPSLALLRAGDDSVVLQARHPELEEHWLYCEWADAVVFTENETNFQRLFGIPNASPYVKDGINDYIVSGRHEAVNPAHTGTKAAAHYILNIAAGQTVTVRLRLTAVDTLPAPFGDPFTALMTQRQQEADAFYQRISPFPLTEDLRNVQRQAFAGLLWSKQYYHYDVDRWLKGDPEGPAPSPERRHGRNHDWWHLHTADVISMPDKWEYPWFAAWDLAFHTIALALIDPDFAKAQLILLTREWYMHPNGQLPAYEWAFGDVNPPVHAWAAMRVYQIEQKVYGRSDRAFLERVFQKLLLNFTWWVNRKDAEGNNVFAGGFLGLDNIGAFDRNSALASSVSLEQADGTSWMAMFCLNMLRIAQVLAEENPVYEDIAIKFFEHFIYIAAAINSIGGAEGLWDELDGFYYDMVKLPDGCCLPMREHSIAGLVPLFAVSTTKSQVHIVFPEFGQRIRWFLENRPDLAKNIASIDRPGIGARTLLAVVDPTKLRRILAKTLDEHGLMSPYGIRSVSKYHDEHPFIFEVDGQQYQLDYEPAESTTVLFGGNSNWRGPVWLPLNYLLIESLQQFHYYLGDDYRVECPTGSGQELTLWEITTDLSRRLVALFLKDESGRRPLYGGKEKFQTDPYWRDLILFHEYFHGDTGVGLGASHQTGWTSVVAKLIQQYGEYHLQGKPPQLIEEEQVFKVEGTSRTRRPV
jgi:hypothetical protein